ncbi:bifunctional phosphoribosyl-AMP cyclohydrolase/phosphoribosyl-ATP diphosphatase, partial [Vibrio navarrensis]
MSFSTADVNALQGRIDWQKVDGLVPAIVQDFQSSQVLMMGYMNQEALAKTG